MQINAFISMKIIELKSFILKNYNQDFRILYILNGTTWQKGS